MTSTSQHPARQKALLRQMLAVDRVVTTAQLQRHGLLGVADRLELPQVTYACRTRINQPTSEVNLTFVAWASDVLSGTPSELMHLAGLAEARQRLGPLASGSEWRHISLAGNLRTQLPDAEIVHSLPGLDGAVEFDAGYDTKKRVQKLKSFVRNGYTRLYWMTTIHGRVSKVMHEMQQLEKQGLLPHVLDAEVVFVNFWSVRDPYVNRPRCHKPFRLRTEFLAWPD